MSEEPNLEWTAQAQDSAPVQPEQRSLLREAREASQQDIGVLAAALKVPVKKLEALEAGRYEDLPGLTFARALASGACRQLKIDPAPVLAQIPAAVTPVLGDSSQNINEPFKTPRDVMVPGAAVRWLRRPVVLVVMVLLLGALLLYVWPQTPSAQEPVALAGNPAVSQDARDVQGSVPVVSDALVVAASQPVVTRSENPAASQVTPAPPAGQGQGLLSLSATGESWAEVLGSKGEVLLQRVLKTGEVVTFSSAPPYTVVIGRADAVQVSVRGASWDTAPYTRNSVARFEVK
ncbi:MAG: helix-turn-helix domain-containing protein [Hydrogenophaga sp.]